MHPTPFSSTSSLRIRKPLGIDLGTTNSVVALLDPTDSTLLVGQDEQGRRTFPSLVGYDPEQHRLVAGRAARHLPTPGAGPSLTLPLASVKRFMGLDRRFEVGPERLSPPEASACILRLLRDMMARTLADTRYQLDSAIVTMPAYFNHNQIEAVRQAGELAGYEVLELLHEPTAAAIYYSWVERHGDATYLVYDLGGGTFDVSIIRRRLDDYEVLSVSGDPFLGGDDFDRLLASHLLEAGRWTCSSTQSPVPPADLEPLFALDTPAGIHRFARLVQSAESIKADLTQADRVDRYLPDLVTDADGKALTLEATIERAQLNALIRDKVERTLDACHEALARARERAGLRLADIDHVILVGGSSRLPLVRETVRAAFCSSHLAEHARSPEPLLHEPDLCVAYGAALRAATHGTRFRFSLAPPASTGMENTLELHLASPVRTQEVAYHAAGSVRRVAGQGQRPLSAEDALLGEGSSVRIRSLATGLMEEAFLDARGTFAQEVQLQPQTDNALELVLCDDSGADLAQLVLTVRHQPDARTLGQAVLPTQLITKPLQIEVLNRARQRIKHIVAPVGSTLPGTFSCTCRTQDQAGRIVVPIFEENRVIKQMVIQDIDPALPIGSPVEVELSIDVRHTITVQVRVRAGRENDRLETATIEAPPPPRRPARADIDALELQITALLPQLRGSFRSRVRMRAAQLRQDLLEALRYDDEPRAIQRFAELLELRQQLEISLSQALDPPWPRFEQLMRQCLDLAAEVADRTGRDRQELFDYVHAQERYAEQAFEEQRQTLYQECHDNLQKYAGYLGQLLRDSLPRPLSAPEGTPEEEAKRAVDRFRSVLGSLWKQVRERGRTDLEPGLADIARQAGGLTLRIKNDAPGALRETHRLGIEIDKIADLLEHGHRRATSGEAGLLEGSS